MLFSSANETKHSQNRICRWSVFFRTRDQIALTFVTKPKNSDVTDQVADQVIQNSTALPFKFNLEIHAVKKGTVKLLTHSNSTQNVRYLCIIQIQYFLVNCDTFVKPPVTEVYVHFFENLNIFLSFSQYVFIRRNQSNLTKKFKILHKNS